jgi:hypothetical protein
MEKLSYFNVGRATATGGTAFTALIMPFTGVPGAAFNVFDLSKTPKNFGFGVTHISKMCYTTGGTAHQIGIMRPFNYTWTTAAAAVNQTDIVLYDDPGVYSTNLKYPSQSGKPAQVSNNAIAANDYVVYQLVDGTWIVDTVSSVSTLTVTLTTNIPNITGGGVAAGAPVYFFGTINDKNPLTGLVNPQNTIAASQTRDASWSDSGFPVVSALHPGDPLIFYSPNGTNAGTLEFLHGFYSKR